MIRYNVYNQNILFIFRKIFKVLFKINILIKLFQIKKAKQKRKLELKSAIVIPSRDNYC